MLKLFVLLIIAATSIQFKPIWLALKSFWFGRRGMYQTCILGKTYVWLDKPTTYKAITDPDFIIYKDGSVKFFDGSYLHASFILTYFPILPGIAFLLLRLQVRRFSKLDKYFIKSSEIDELKQSTR